MNIPEDKTSPELIERVKALFGITFTDNLGAEITAFDYKYGKVFHVRDKCEDPIYNGTSSACSIEYFIDIYDEYLERCRVKKENNAKQFIRDNGVVAMVTYVDASKSCLFDSTTIQTLSIYANVEMFSGIFNASLFGREIKITPIYAVPDNNYGVAFEFNKQFNVNYWTLERNPNTESGYESTCSDQDYLGINKFNYRHLNAVTLDDIFNKGVDGIFNTIKTKFCTGEKIGVNKAGDTFMLPSKYVCESAAINGIDECGYRIKFGHMHTDTRYTRGYKDTCAIPKIATYITDDEFITMLRSMFESKARPMYELTKKKARVK